MRKTRSAVRLLQRSNSRSTASVCAAAVRREERGVDGAGRDAGHDGKVGVGDVSRDPAQEADLVGAAGAAAGQENCQVVGTAGPLRPWLGAVRGIGLGQVVASILPLGGEQARIVSHGARCERIERARSAHGDRWDCWTACRSPSCAARRIGSPPPIARARRAAPGRSGRRTTGWRTWRRDCRRRSRRPARFWASCAAGLPACGQKSLLELGAGPAPGLWAAERLFPELSSATHVEVDAGMAQLGRRLLKAGRFDARVESTWLLRDVARARELGAHDLVLVGYVLGELPASARDELVDAAWNVTAAALVIVEPGTPAGAARVMRARARLDRPGRRRCRALPSRRRVPAGVGRLVPLRRACRQIERSAPPQGRIAGLRGREVRLRGGDPRRGRPVRGAGAAPAGRPIPPGIAAPLHIRRVAAGTGDPPRG